MWWVSANSNQSSTQVDIQAGMLGTTSNQISLGMISPDSIVENQAIEFPERIDLPYLDFLGISRTLTFEFTSIATDKANTFEWHLQVFDASVGNEIVGRFELNLSYDISGRSEFLISPLSGENTVDILTSESAFQINVGYSRIMLSFSNVENSLVVNGQPQFGPVWNSVSYIGDSADILTNSDIDSASISSEDFLDLSALSDPVSIYLASGVQFSSENRIKFDSIEHVFGTAEGDRLVSSSDDNYLNGWLGDDVLRSKGGDDTLDGGSGNDTITGDFGEDFLIGGIGNDWISGNAGNDVLRGGSGQDTLRGGRDEDTVLGGDGSDLMFGNLGHDNLSGQEGQDTLLGGGGNDTMFGGSEDDYLVGENGADVLFGGAGDDVLLGGLFGGSFDGFADVFVYKSASEGGGGFDNVRGFENGVDLIDLSSFGYQDFHSEVFTLASERPSGLRLDWGSGNVLFLEDISLSDFDASDVIL